MRERFHQLGHNTHLDFVLKLTLFLSCKNLDVAGNLLVKRRVMMRKRGFKENGKQQKEGWKHTGKS